MVAAEFAGSSFVDVPVASAVETAIVVLGDFYADSAACWARAAGV